MTRPYLVCGQCRHFTGEPHPSLGPFCKLCSALNHGVMADTTAAEHCEHFLPPRIQLRRTRGWKKPEGAVVVSRPSRWGNPFPFRVSDAFGKPTTARFAAVAEYRRALRAGELAVTPEDVRSELRGKALCCWCPVGKPCHADVLLKVAHERSGGDGG